MKTLSKKQQATNSLVNGLSTILGGIHMVSSVIADTSLHTEAKLYKKYYTKEDGTKMDSNDINQVLRNRLLKTEAIKVRLKIEEVDMEKIFSEASE